MKLNKNIKIFINYFLGPLLFAWLSFAIFRQIRQQPGLEEAWISIKNSFGSQKLLYLVLVFVLMLVNWSLEAMKWRISVQQVQPVSFLRSFRAILSGVSFSVTTPNRTGEYLGRVLYMNEGNRLKVISLTILGSISQLIITILMGAIGLILLKGKIFESGLSGWSPWIHMIISGSFVVVFFITVFYFKLEWLVNWLERIPLVKKYNWLIRELEKINTSVLIRLLSLSMIRYLVFCLQYYLAFQFFGIDIGWWPCFWAIAVVFIINAAIPGIALFEVVQKVFIAKEIIGLFTQNVLGIGLATTTIWFINLLIPAAIGSLLIISLKIFKKENEEP